MVKINFQNNITKANADTFNTMQDNIENAITSESTTLTNYIDNKVLDIYSTTETRIGTWIDGKPLYRCTLQKSITSSTSTTIDSIDNVDYINIIRGNTTFVGGGNKYFVPLSTYESSTNFSKFYIQKSTSTNTAQIRWTGSSTTGTLYATVEYTKTTD